MHTLKSSSFPFFCLYFVQLIQVVPNSPLLSLEMALKDKRKAAARARAGKSSLGQKREKSVASTTDTVVPTTTPPEQTGSQHAHASSPSSSYPLPNPNDDSMLPEFASDLQDKFDEMLYPPDSGDGSDSDCGYIGGVSVEISESESKSEDWEDSDSDDKSLSELSGDDLDENMAKIQAELEALQAPSVFAMMMEGKTRKQWKKAESDRGLGYNRHSDRTQQRRERDARDRAASRESAWTSYVISTVSFVVF
jgi:hypothetical protein